MKKSKKHWYRFVPSLFTSLNLVCGIIASYLSVLGKIDVAFAIMLIGLFFDFIDGFVARLLKVSGDFGKELDSLADLITFGLLPGTMVFFIIQTHITGFSSTPASLSFIQWFFVFVPIIIPVFSALRLAKFNIDERQKSEFIGLPTPANALFFASLCYTFLYKSDSILSIMNNPLAISIAIIIFSWLLISEIPLFALKFKTFKWKDNILRYVFLIISLLILLFFRIPGFSAVIILYIILSIGMNLVKTSRK